MQIHCEHQDGAAALSMVAPQRSVWQHARVDSDAPALAALPGFDGLRMAIRDDAEQEQREPGPHRPMRCGAALLWAAVCTHYYVLLV